MHLGKAFILIKKVEKTCIEFFTKITEFLMVLNGPLEGFLPIKICENENSKDKTGYNSYPSMNLKASPDPTYNQEKGLFLAK